MRYGICLLSCLPVRREAGDRHEMTNQLLFGETYRVIEEKEKWLYVEGSLDNYPGWIAKVQHHQINEEEYKVLQRQKLPRSMALVQSAQLGEEVRQILRGSSLPYLQEEGAQLAGQRLTWPKEMPILDEPQPASVLSQIALMYLGTPYLWGGRSPFGIDCSGLSQIVFHLAGYRLPRDAYQQGEQGEPISDIREAQAGDLAFFEREGRIVHVGILPEPAQWTRYYPTQPPLKEGELPIIQAFDRVRIDRLDSHGLYNVEVNRYTHIFHSLRRIL